VWINNRRCRLQGVQDCRKFWGEQVEREHAYHVSWAWIPWSPWWPFRWVFRMTSHKSRERTSRWRRLLLTTQVSLSPGWCV
jgi:hypothetical protein